MMRATSIDGSDRAVSPVIGVVLMVAITVILAAVIGTFVLGLSDSLTTTPPQASFTVEDVNGDTVTLVKTGGEALNATDLAFAVGGDRLDGTPVGGGEWHTGDARSITHGVTDSGEQTFRVIHDPTGSILYETTINTDG